MNHVPTEMPSHLPDKFSVAARFFFASTVRDRKCVCRRRRQSPTPRVFREHNRMSDRPPWIRCFCLRCPLNPSRRALNSTHRSRTSGRLKPHKHRHAALHSPPTHNCQNYWRLHTRPTSRSKIYLYRIGAEHSFPVGDNERKSTHRGSTGTIIFVGLLTFIQTYQLRDSTVALGYAHWRLKVTKVKGHDWKVGQEKSVAVLVDALCDKWNQVSSHGFPIGNGFHV